MTKDEVKEYLDKLDRVYEAAMNQCDYRTALSALECMFNCKTQTSK